MSDPQVPGPARRPPASLDDERLARTAAAFARREAGEAEEAIAAHVAAAIRAWRLDDATFWQRVKFKARLLRAARRSGTADVDGGRYAC